MEEIKNLLKWYQHMGVNEINLDTPGQLTKKPKSSSPKEK